MKLSDLQTLISTILEKEGDMDVIRIRSLDIDGIVQNDFSKNNIIYSQQNFNIIQDENKKYFVINTPFYTE